MSKTSLEADLTNDNAIYFVALNSDEKIIGVIGGTNLVDHIDISIVITKKEYLRQGIASSLLTHFINYSIENNIEKIFLEVRKSNTSAINLYTKHNFTNISIRKNYYSNNEDALIYMLENSESF